MQAPTVQDGLQCKEVDPELTQIAEVPVTVQACSILACSNASGLESGFQIIAINQILQHLFILLYQSMAAVIAQNARENILVVGEMLLQS
jgi:hypothetical protein